MKYEETKIKGVIQMLEAGMTQRSITQITEVSMSSVGRISVVLNAIRAEEWDKVELFLQDGIMKSAAQRVLRIKNITLPKTLPAPEPVKEVPASAAPASPAPAAANIDFLRGYTEQMLQYMTALNRKLSEMDANLQKVMVDCQRQSNANTDVLMTELSKLTSLTEAIKCNTRKPK